MKAKKTKDAPRVDLIIDVEALAGGRVVPPLVAWDQHASGMSTIELMAVADKLASLAIEATRAAAYFNTRSRLPHESAVRDANNAVAKLRKALGFTQKRDDVNF